MAQARTARFTVLMWNALPQRDRQYSRPFHRQS
jgi:hypothetical protein